MNEDEKEIWGCFGLWAGIIGITILGTILNGWALATLWAWFIVPVFGLPHLAITQAIGVALVVGYLAKDYQKPEENKSITEKLVTLFLFVLLKPGFAVGAGWVIVQFVG